MEKPQYKDIVYTMAQHEQLLLRIEKLEKQALSKSYIGFYNYEYNQNCFYYSDEETVAYFKDLILEANYHQYEFNRFKLMLEQQMQINNVLNNDLNEMRIRIIKLLENKKPKRFLGFLWKLKENK